MIEGTVSAAVVELLGIGGRKVALYGVEEANRRFLKLGTGWRISLHPSLPWDTETKG